MIHSFFQIVLTVKDNNRSTFSAGKITTDISDCNSFKALRSSLSKFYCFRPGPHISFKYARHNHLRCLMMGEVSLKR